MRGLDLRLAPTDLATAEAELKDARNRIQIVTRRLEILLGRYPAGNEVSAIRLPPLPNVIAAGLPSELLERRPDVVAAFTRLKAADFRTTSAKKLRLPRITLTASGGTRSTDLTDLIDPRSVAWNVFAGLMQPILTGGRIEGKFFVTKHVPKKRSIFIKIQHSTLFARLSKHWPRKNSYANRKWP